MQGLYRVCHLLWRTLRYIFTSLPERRLAVAQMYQIGVRSLPVVLLTGCSTGMVVAVQSYGQFAKMNMTSALGAVVSAAMVRELGPVLTALLLAGRVGSAITAELGTMRVTEQIDALRTLGTDPVRHLVVPRFLACVLLTPVLTLFSDGIGVFGGWFYSVKVLSVDSHYFWVFAEQFTTNWDIVSGMIKAVFFGGIIAIVCCYRGFNTGPGAEGVGRATTAANVGSCIAILVANLFLSVLLNAIYEQVLA